jgi:hypothetical protein
MPERADMPAFTTKRLSRARRLNEPKWMLPGRGRFLQTLEVTRSGATTSAAFDPLAASIPQRVTCHPLSSGLAR